MPCARARPAKGPEQQATAAAPWYASIDGHGDFRDVAPAYGEADGAAQGRDRREEPLVARLG